MQALLDGLKDHGYKPIFVTGKPQIRETLLQTLETGCVAQE
jgi:hypothetical protein